MLYLALALALALTLTRYDYDGELYSRGDFVAEYGGTREWEQARRDPLWAAAAVAAAQLAAKAAAEAQVADAVAVTEAAIEAATVYKRGLSLLVRPTCI